MRDYYIEGCDYDEEWSDLREGRRHLAEYPGFLGEPIYLDPRWLAADPQQAAELQHKSTSSSIPRCADFLLSLASIRESLAHGSNWLMRFSSNCRASR